MKLFLILNLYSHLSLLGGLVGSAFSFYVLRENIFFPWSIFLLLPTLYLLGLSWSLYSSSSTKIRAYAMLINRNQKKWDPESFTDFMSAPCGRLLVRKVLHDLGKSSEYANIRKMPKKKIESIKFVKSFETFKDGV